MTPFKEITGFNKLEKRRGVTILFVVLKGTVIYTPTVKLIETGVPPVLCEEGENWNQDRYTEWNYSKIIYTTLVLELYTNTSLWTGEHKDTNLLFWYRSIGWPGSSFTQCPSCGPRLDMELRFGPVRVWSRRFQVGMTSVYSFLFINDELQHPKPHQKYAVKSPLYITSV